MKTATLLKANFYQILLVFISFLVMVLVSYFYVSTIVRQQMRNIGDVSMDATQMSVSSSLRETELLFANIVLTVEGLLSSHKSNDDILLYLKETNAYYSAVRTPIPHFMKVYGYIRGEWLDGSGWVPPSAYVPQSRPWHIGAENNNGRIYFSEPYVDAETGGMCISFSQKVFDQYGNANGVLAVDLKLNHVSVLVRNQKVAGNGYGVLIDDTMTFLVHRNPDMAGMKMDSANGDYPRLAKLFNSGGQISAVRFRDADGTDSVIFFRTVFNGWHIGIIIPCISYYREVYSLAVVLGVLGFLLAVVLSSLLVRMWVQKTRADEESSSKSSFLARMSHEMRTPMNAIIGMANIAKMSDDPKRKEYCLDRISDASTHLLGVINDVLDMSKISAGRLELSKTAFPLGGMLRQVETVVHNNVEEKRQTLSISVAADVPKVLVADRQLLAQVITNLLSNANKFTPEGGHINLRIRRLRDADGMCILEFTVKDDGIGITKEQQARLFRPFEQADGSISRKYGGTGLGLAISKQIVEMMGGDIRIDSEPDTGTRFIFTVHAHEVTPTDEFEDEGEHRNLSDAQRPDFTGRRILLAEDVAINREILIALLDGTGMRIESAENGRMACDMFAASPDAYDMIFMDIHMPEMDGYEATRRIRAMPCPRAVQVPIVAMTANVFQEDIERCLQAGMDGHVGKPINLEEVLRMLRLYLPRSGAA
ncbi:MAG: response regulator [Desulfovibrio sp.]|jgi:signal transduction histidine kinase|nr:response regulator [Desulfovibrio sp.]